MGKKVKVIFWVFLALLLFPARAQATSPAATNDCGERYLTVVNPVRGRTLWADKSLNPIKDQYGVLAARLIPATWLLQYDALKDSEILGVVKGFNESQEIGLFMEVSPKLTNDSKVIYPFAAAWDDPHAVFLSGYSQSERKKLINRTFNEFKKRFGRYPSTVGAWWIDSYSLNYMFNKYAVRSVMIVANQKTTDDYGVWGQWWGGAYYPSRANTLVPANTLSNKLDVVVVQWALRDLTKAYGPGPVFSNNSLQANDYLSLGKNTDYSLGLARNYLDCQNELAQLTLGLETGMESSSFLGEFEKQLDLLLTQVSLNPVTVSQFSSIYKSKYPQLSPGFVFNDGISKWELNTGMRKNDYLGDFIKYEEQIAFSDYFVKDQSAFLKRYLPLENKEGQSNYLVYIILTGFIILIALRLVGYKTLIVGFLFYIACFGLILKGGEKWGWEVYYSSPYVSSGLIKLILLFVSILPVLFFRRYGKSWIYAFFLPLAFGLDVIIRTLRFGIISGNYLIGLASNSLDFIGIELGKDGFRFINKTLDSVIAGSLLRVKFEKYFENGWFSLLIYPALHIVVAIFLVWLFKKNHSRGKMIIILVLSLLFFAQLFYLFKADPTMVIPIK